MDRTHKKILGFAGLGLVTAITIAAAALPGSEALAVSSVSDTVQVRVTTVDPELTVTASASGTIETPEYGYKILYNHIGTLTATLYNRNDAGTVIHSEQILSVDTGYEVGELERTLDLDNYGGEGNFTIVFTGIGQGGVPIERILEIKYKKPTPEPEPEPEPEPKPDDKGDTDTDEDGNASVDINVPGEEVKSVTINVYDENGNLVKTVDVDDPSEVEKLDLSDLPDGNYTIEVISRDDDGNVIGTTTKVAIVDTDGTGEDKVKIPIEEQEEETKKVIITVVDDEGNVVKTIEIENPTPGSDVDIDFSDLDEGNYHVIVDYYDENGEKIGSTTTDVTKSDDEGNVSVDIDKTIDTVTTIEGAIYDEDGNIVRRLVADRETGTVYVYDANGNLIEVIPNGYKDGKFIIPMTDLPSGNYTTVITFKDANGKIIGNGVTVKVKYDGGQAIVVPDTGSFFQGLNISREDYLITGLVVFMVIGVVAFGVVARNRRNGKATASFKNRK